MFRRAATRWVPVISLLGLILPTAPVLVQDDQYDTYRKQALFRLQQALADMGQRPITTDTMIETAHLCFFLGEITDRSLREERLALYTRGIRLASAVREDEPHNKAAILWGALNTLGEMRITRRLSALIDIVRIRDDMEQLNMLDETFEYGAADRVLAKIYQETPRWISIGSKRKAKRHFRQALTIAPTFPANLLLYAEFLLEQGKPEEAKALALKVRTSNRLEAFPLYEYQWRMTLLKILRK